MRPNFLHKQIPFVASLKKKALIGIGLGAFLAFVIIFLEPFDTNQFHSSYRYALLSGFGVVLTVTYLGYSLAENLWYNQTAKQWQVWHEVLSLFLFFVLAGNTIYVYNTKVVNGDAFSLGVYVWYCANIIMVFIPILAPILYYLRKRLGECIVPLPESTVVLSGENKNELLTIHKDQLLYAKATQNYIAIYYLSPEKKVLNSTFRQTLANLHKQAPFLQKCHRSYLVYLPNVSEIQGNSQNAKLIFEHTPEQIPLSKTLYKSIKNNKALV